MFTKSLFHEVVLIFQRVLIINWNYDMIKTYATFGVETVSTKLVEQVLYSATVIVIGYRFHKIINMSITKKDKMCHLVMIFVLIKRIYLDGYRGLGNALSSWQQIWALKIYIRVFWEKNISSRIFSHYCSFNHEYN